MPTNKTRFTLILTAGEKVELIRKAQTKGFDSLAEYIRSELQLPPLRRGAKLGNRHAAKNCPVA
jgi:hypothetical protein